MERQLTDKKEKKPHKKQMTGIVISDKMDKSVVVSVETLKQHPIYKKYIKRSKRYMVHDERNECKTGDVVRIIETRPISKRKTWKLVGIIERAK
jgi:small subunit ribosomal protein S17